MYLEQNDSWTRRLSLWAEICRKTCVDLRSVLSWHQLSHLINTLNKNLLYVMFVLYYVLVLCWHHDRKSFISINDVTYLFFTFVYLCFLMQISFPCCQVLGPVVWRAQITLSSFTFLCSTSPVTQYVDIFGWVIHTCAFHCAQQKQGHFYFSQWNVCELFVSMNLGCFVYVKKCDL